MSFSSPNDTEPLDDEAAWAIRRGLDLLMASDKVLFAIWLPDVRRIKVMKKNGNTMHFQMEEDITKDTMKAIENAFANAGAFATSGF